MLDASETRTLTPVQEQVIAAIVGGATIQAAAEAASIHRNTVAYWRRTSVSFREALLHAQYEKALAIREQAETFAADAWAAIRAILDDPKSSPTVRLAAAKFIIDKAATPPPPEPEPLYRMETIAMSFTHKDAQSPVDPVHKVAQNPVPEVGRNTPCPCGSGLKFKRCCLGKPNLAAAA